MMERSLPSKEYSSEECSLKDRFECYKREGLKVLEREEGLRVGGQRAGGEIRSREEGQREGRGGREGRKDASEKSSANDYSAHIRDDARHRSTSDDVRHRSTGGISPGKSLLESVGGALLNLFSPAARNQSTAEYVGRVDKNQGSLPSSSLLDPSSCFFDSPSTATSTPNSGAGAGN